MKLNFEDKLTIYRLKSQGYDGLRRISTRSAPKNGYIASLCLPLSQDNKKTICFLSIYQNKCILFF
ncbi:Uncharacterised protein [Streptococcus mutans]|nr:Uncharacterised protein [Streptococcus mutans]